MPQPPSPTAKRTEGDENAFGSNDYDQHSNFDPWRYTMVKPRYSCLPPRKSSSSTLILTLLVLILLALGILSWLCGTHDRSEGEEGRGERWVEIISWELTAFVYHNFLVYGMHSDASLTIPS
ncbi:hypothetical protein K1719_001298 [Acacia pycnantha]|nr:hypothetical protein K1719_001298 [Acacia pycnantha]